MKKTFSRLFLILSVMILFESCEKEDLKIDGKIESFTITSKIINDAYPIQVFLPLNYSQEQTNQLIIGLDGELHFSEISSIISEKVANGSMPPCLFIGVGNTKGRNRDYTPTVYEHGLGGAQNYYRFLKEELIPELESRYNINPSNEKTLMGNSFGGLFTHYVMFQNRADNPFDKFISVGCSFWFDSGVIFKYESDYSVKNSDLNVKYFSGMGSLEGGVNLASFDEMSKRLINRNYPNFRISTEIIKKHGHSESSIIGFKKGLNYVFTK
jgi:uncharacterized protein